MANPFSACMRLMIPACASVLHLRPFRIHVDLPGQQAGKHESHAKDTTMTDPSSDQSSKDQISKTDIDLRRDTAVIRIGTGNDAGLDAEALKSRRTITIVVYVLQALAFFIGITGLIAIIVNYVKRADMQGTWLASHFRWQIRTFWFGLLWGLVGVLLLKIYIGALIALANVVWVIYRIVRGLLAVIDNKPMYEKG